MKRYVVSDCQGGWCVVDRLTLTAAPFGADKASAVSAQSSLNKAWKDHYYLFWEPLVIERYGDVYPTTEGDV